MIASVRLPTAGFPYVEARPELPGVPALTWSGFLIGCRDTTEVTKALKWCVEIRRCRPKIPIAMAVPLQAFDLTVAAAQAVNVTPVLRMEEFSTGRPPSKVLVTLEKNAVESIIATEWIARSNASDLETAELLHTLAAHAVRGGKVPSVSRSMGFSQSTLARRLLAVGLAPPGRLLTEGRVRAAQIRESWGLSRTQVAEAGGWWNPKAMDTARRRFNRNRDTAAKS